MQDIDLSNPHYQALQVWDLSVPKILQIKIVRFIHHHHHHPQLYRKHTKGTQSIVDRHENNAMIEQILWIVHMRTNAAVSECSTMNAHHHRCQCDRRHSSCVDIQMQTVFIAYECVIHLLAAERTATRESQRWLCPRFWWLWCLQ